LAALRGSDWAEATPARCLQAAGTAHRERLQLAHTPAALDAWGTTLRTWFHGHPVAVGLARDQGPLGSALRTSAWLVLCPLTPLTLARSREAFPPSRATDDPPDAALPLARRLTPRHKLPPRMPQSSPRRALAPRVAHRRRGVGDTGRMPQRLTSALTPSCPHVRHGLPDNAPPLFGACLRRWPTLQAAPRPRRSTRARFVRDPPGRAPEVLARRLQAISAALPLTTDAGGIAPHALVVHALVAQRRVTWQALAACDTASAPRAQSHPACPLFQALPGAGPVFASRLFVAFGAQRARSPSATTLQQ
jgi:hypothetical protein